MPTLYPAALDTDNSLWVAKNGLQAILQVDPGVGGVTINVNSTTGFPATGYIALESEVILYTGTTATAFTGCTRGADGTTASAHAVNTPAYGCNAADHHNALKDAIKALQAKVGVNSNGAIGTTLDGNQIAAGTIHASQLAVASPSSGQLAGVGPVNLTTTHRFRGYASGTVSVGASSTAIVPINTVVFDGAGGLNTGTFRYTIQAGGGGFWIFGGRNSLASTLRTIVSVWKNAVTEYRGHDGNNNTNASGGSALVFDQFVAGDIIDLRITNLDAGAAHNNEGGLGLATFWGILLFST